MTEATLNGSVTSCCGIFSYYFEYGTTTAYGTATPTVVGTGAIVDLAVIANITNLSPDTTYHFRAVAEGSFGSMSAFTAGGDATFTTAAASTSTPVVPPPESTSPMPPVAAATAWPIDNKKGKTKKYELDGTNSYDADGTVASYEWILKGKTLGRESTLTQSLQVGKTYTYTLRVTDNAGLTNTTTVKVKPASGKIKKPIRLRLQAETLFAFNEFKLASSAKKHMAAIAKRLRRLGAKRLKVNGYTDAIGTDAYNLKLSRNRAATIGTLLRKKLRLSKRKVVEKGFGESRPVSPNTLGGQDNPAGRAKNRRVEITAYFK